MPSRPPLDGHNFIAQAIAHGATAIVGTKNLPTELGVPYIQVLDSRAALGDLARAYWGDPGAKLKLIGVTGSKGKSTTTTLIHHLLEHAGVVVARISTVGVSYRGQEEVLSGHFTTPEAPEVQALLSRFVDAGCTHAVLEVSSHALALERVRGLEFDTGVWVNFIADDHLDFHGTAEHYFAAKRQMLEHSNYGILNSDDLHYPQANLKHQSYGLQNIHADWRATHVREYTAGLSFEVQSPLRRFDVEAPMIGMFNVSNILAALACAARYGLDVPELRDGLATFMGVPGRMQIVQAKPFRVINDFAHTEASVRAALQTLRQNTSGRIILLVGAAGERDVARRDGIGRAAVGADEVIFTEEDCRGENLDAILQTMRNAFILAGGRNVSIVPDRREAITQAMRFARTGDTVLLAGKGHERTLERAGETILWDETSEAKLALKNL